MALATGLAAVAFATPALAAPDGEGDPFERAVEESGVEPLPPQRFSLPEGTLKVTPSSLLAANPGSRIHFTVTLAETVPGATLRVRLPRRWLTVPASGIRAIRAPRLARPARRRARVRRSGRTVKLALERTAAGQTASFDIVDVGIPAGTYRLPFSWRDENGRRTRAGTATVRFYAPSREGPKPNRWARLASPGFTTNASGDGIQESETFVATTRGNRDRLAVGSNWSSASMPAWISDDGGHNWTQRTLPNTIDAPGESLNEGGDICCDPMFAADDLGNIWFGGLSFANGAGVPSRVVVNRVSAGSTSFHSATVGLRVPSGSSGTQDKPMMTVDNDPGSPTYGRLYAVWNAPKGAGIRVEISQCNSQPNPANCDNADNWSTPVDVTPTTGSYIYADVAVGPDGKVWVVWWDFSSANAIKGDVCNPGSQNCATAAAWSGGAAQSTIATLDSSFGTGLPFSCPIRAQPGGRASTSPQVDVDTSGGADDGRVYVTWSDLRPGSGTTKCDDSVTPATNELTFDSYVGSAAGAFPGGGSPSETAGTRLLTNAETPTTSDDWFAWLAVDQTNGQAWADFYSTRDDATRRKTNFYARSVTPSGGSHSLGPLTKVSSAQSDYSANQCCQFGNDYGDYTGLAATGGLAYPVWNDNSLGDGEVYTFVGAPKPTATTTAATSITASGATLNATINPKGAGTTYHFEYGTAPGAYTQTTPDQDAGSGSTPVNVSKPISGLDPGTPYYYRVVATNTAGTTDGNEVTFGTLSPPVVTTDAAGAIGLSGATLNATINPRGSSTTYHFEYSETSGGPYTSTPEKSAGSGSSGVAKAEPVSGLSPSTTYFFRVVANNAAGTTSGDEVSFTTDTPVPPTVADSAPTNVSQTSATFNGSVNPNGSTTTYHFDYSETSGGPYTSTPDASAGSGSASVPEFADVTGLDADTDYYYVLVANNVAGPATSGEQHFRTTATPVAPNAATDPATGIGQTTATLNSTINPKGSSTSFHFLFGTSSGSLTSTTADGDAGSGASTVSRSQTVSGLKPNTTYFFRVVATNDGGPTSGSIRSFKTTALPPAPKKPAVSTGAASSIGETGATLAGSVNPNGIATTWRFQYGTSAAYGFTTPLVAATGASPRSVSRALTLLSPDTTYHYRLVATSSAGTTLGSDHTFRTSPVDTTAPRLAVSKRRVRLGSRRRLRVRVKCGAAEPERCRGMLRLYTGRRKLKIGSARFRIAPGRTARVRVKLSRRGGRLLVRAGRLRVLAVARARDSSGNLGRRRARFTLLPRRA